MTEKHPMWNAIKRGMLIGGLVGLDIACLLALDWVHPSYYYGWALQAALGGAAGGFFIGGVASLAWQKLQAPLKRLEADLQSAAALRTKELINEQDYQALKLRLLASYEPASNGPRIVLNRASWAALIGGSLGLLLAVFNTAADSTGVMIFPILPMSLFGIGVGTAAAAIIQSALQGGKRNPISGKVSQMLGAGQFDPLGQAHVNEADRIPAKR